MIKVEWGNPESCPARQAMRRLLVCACLGVQGLAAAQDLSEDGFFGEVPVVLTATRLQQSLHDVPGAMTVLDRDTIRRSGARDVAELLRLVPGYLVGGFNGAHPVAAYHAPLDEYGARNLVLIDGRSVYSSYFLGNTYHGMMTVLPEDIERIEVLRGANSAAYGANAMFGVINIITRHAADSLGAEAQLNVGSTDLRDARVSLGWGDGQAAHRLSAGQREDSGYAGAFDDRRLRVLNWRTDLRPAADQDLMLRAGISDLQAGRGLAHRAADGDPERMTEWDEWFLQGRWQRQLAADSQLQLSADFTKEKNFDRSQVKFPFGGKLFDLVIDYSGRASRSNLELQHQQGLGQGLRAVWGLGWKREQAESWTLFTSQDQVSFDESRAFGNLEWQPSPRWTVNAGIFAGEHSRVGSYAAPRLMFNHHFTPDHTLRFGTNRSLRTNSLLEVAGDIRVYSLGGQELGRIRQGNPGIQPERLRSQEISYFGHLRPLNLMVDLRAYRERLTDIVSVNRDKLVNEEGFTLKGVEYQLSWTPRPGSRLQWQQSFNQLDWDDPKRDAAFRHQPPARASTLAWWQQLPRGFDLALMWHERGKMTWDQYYKGDDRILPAASRVDLRLARPWRLNGSKGEWAFTVQALDGGQAESRVDFLFRRRAFLTLKLEQ
jgi:iron complex outermembrane recepter protein